jgi:NTP pyrophosphatase (non-canonical NTP hydrolase)
MLTLTEYQKKAKVTARKDLSHQSRLANMALGLAGEAGETADHIKKHLFHGHDLDKDKLSKEIGDVLWYVALLADCVGLDLSDVAQGNLNKLQKRYGKEFTVEKSINRAD